MVVSQSPATRDWGCAWWERGLLGVVGVAGVAGSLWLTGLTLFLLALALDCNGPATPAQVAEGMAYGTVCSVGAALAWLLTISLLRVSVGRRGLRRRTWVAAASVVAVLTATYVGIAVATQPSPSASCRPFDLS